MSQNDRETGVNTRSKTRKNLLNQPRPKNQSAQNELNDGSVPSVSGQIPERQNVASEIDQRRCYNDN